MLGRHRSTTALLVTTRWFFEPPWLWHRFPAAVVIVYTRRAISDEPTNEMTGDQGVRRQRADHIGATQYEVHHAGGETRLARKLGQPHCGQRAVLRGLDHHRVATGDRPGEVERDHRREVEGSDDAEDTERLPDVFGVHPGADLLRGGALDQLGYGAGVLDVLQAPNQLAFGLGQRLAVLGNGELGELVDRAAHQLAVAEQCRRPLRHRSHPPFPEGVVRSGNHRVHIGGGGAPLTCDDLARRRVEDIDITAAWLEPFAAGEVAEGADAQCPPPADIQGIEMVRTGGGVLRDLTKRTTPSVTDA